MRNLEPRLTVRALRPLISGLVTLGYDPAPFLQTHGIDRDMLLEPDAMVPMSACVGLLADGVQATGDDNLGLHVAEHAELGSFDVHFYAMVSSPTLGAAFERVCRYQRLIHETSQVRLETSRDQAVLSHRLSGGMAAPRQTAELLLASWVRAGRVATAPGASRPAVWPRRSFAAVASRWIRGGPAGPARLEISVRTLHRTLAAEGTSYKRLLDQLRLEIAERHLRDDRVSVAEVAFLVGFSELSAFYRAFKRWTGCTPAAFRARARRRPHSHASA